MIMYHPPCGENGGGRAMACVGCKVKGEERNHAENDTDVNYGGG